MNNLAVFFEITNICNHRCVHCCKYWEDNSVSRTADKDTLDKIIALPKSHLTISGGEPGLSKDNVFYLINNEKSDITINTNLTQWTEDEIIYLNSLSNVTLNISVVSLLRDSYVKITNADTYDIFLKNLKVVSKNNIVSVIINNISLPTLEYTVRILIMAGFYNILVSPQTPTPYNSVDTNSVVQKVIKLHDQYKNISWITTQGCIGAEYCDHECEAGIKRILIDTKGNIYPCAPIHKPCLLGHLGDDIEDIKRKGRNFYLSYPIDERKLCKGFMV